jgi:hypothetical protein
MGPYLITITDTEFIEPFSESYLTFEGGRVIRKYRSQRARRAPAFSMPGSVSSTNAATDAATGTARDARDNATRDAAK